MTVKLLLPLAALSVLVLAGCDSSAPNTSASVPAETAAAPAEAPAAGTPGAALDEAMKALQEQAANMSPEAKAAAVADARKAGEEVARSQGLSDEMIKQAGDAAESAVKKALGVQ